MPLFFPTSFNALFAWNESGGVLAARLSCLGVSGVVDLVLPVCPEERVVLELVVFVS